ncbi:P-loop containing nucleoside triphosphate hydrolase protein [Radiomyces spectabilis]|uniref:P-loop containing nucleoside triphosphate hydrolase protein n=1 Tax=Radiomyces spectabilis TaxID=64574 RepID=UPI00221F6650|nr:P-loop containing nucleoside triphosphate hydrolase protein [Radiomyces spectabilis]KAI8388265.1 P-loop containing nucleoside triphosphate hydrolase protein [Radiomyces spectabilis]
MAKKKSKKVASARGYATVSMPSKKEPTTSKPESEEPSPPPQTVVPPPVIEDPIVNNATDRVSMLAERLGNANEHKVEMLLNNLQRVGSQKTLSELKKFDLSPELQYELWTVLQQQGVRSQESQTKENALQDIDPVIAQIHVIYRGLAKLGFAVQDIEQSLEATKALTIEANLDWLCVHVPYERLPIGYFDKYYSDQKLSVNMVVHDDTAKIESGEPTTETESKVTSMEDLPIQSRKEKQETKEDVDSMKQRTLQAAQQYLYDDDEEEENINEQHAKLAMELTVLEDQLPSKKKGKKAKQQTAHDLTPEEMQIIQAKMKKLRERMSSLENDFEYDKSEAHNIFLDMKRKAVEKAKEEKERRASRSESEPQPREIASKQAVDPLTENSDDDDLGDIFGGLSMLEQTESPKSTTVSYTVIDLTVRNWMGKYPKDLLEDYCRKKQYRRLSFSADSPSTAIFRASLRLTDQHDTKKTIELPADIALASANEAKQYVSMQALYDADPQSLVYQVLPEPYKDIWRQWKVRDEEREKSARIESNKAIVKFAIQLAKQSANQSAHIRSERKAEEDDPASTIVKSTRMSRSQLERKKRIFSQVKEKFKQRLPTEAYKNMYNQRKDLPITHYRDNILQLLETHQVVVISGETGCGKSTQVPQFLAEDLLQGSKALGSVICTQPRRISAMSIAQRVSTEMGDPPRMAGSREAMVGYQIRLDSRVSEENVLLFCTTGILLRRLESDRYLEGVTHVVVDEVHERTVESDFLLLVLRRLCEKRSDLRIILMSATVQAERFTSYFGDCPVVSVPGRTFPVHVQYLEDVIERTGYVFERDSYYANRSALQYKAKGTVNVSGMHGSSQQLHYEMLEDDSDGDDPYDVDTAQSKLITADDKEEESAEPMYSKQTRKMVHRMDENKINYDLILQLLEYVCSTRSDAAGKEIEKPKDIPEEGAILVFLPGMPEIRRLYDALANHSAFGDEKKFIVIALHSTLSSEHQEKAFDVPPKGMRKIVLSTNIAETGITISDVTVVIDTGMAKVVSYDEKKKITRLRQMHIAKANARQRRGRAGRVQEGVCFHMFTKQKYEEMADHETPEILRLPLEELCLRIKICKLGSIHGVLAEALDPPSKKMIDSAIQTLCEVQALTSDGLESLTPLGIHLADLPVDVHIGKMILFGAIFRCLDPILTIAAALSFKSPFVRPFGQEREADEARAKFSYANSDFWTIYKAYDSWRKEYEKVKDSSNWKKKIRDFCRKHYLSERNLEMVEDMKRQYLGLLASIGFVRSEDRSMMRSYDVKRSINLCKVPDIYNSNSLSVPVVNAAITAGLYPKLAVYSETNHHFMNGKLMLDIHPTSILFGKEDLLKKDFLVYNTVVMSKNIYLWEAASVHAIAIILLASNLDIKHVQRRFIVNDWIYLDCFARTAALLKYLQQELSHWLALKISDPRLDLTTHAPETFNVLVKLLESS